MIPADLVLCCVPAGLSVQRVLYSILCSTVNAQDPRGGEASGYVGEILFFTVIESSIVTPDF